MANDITVTKNTTSGSERWDVEYTADASGTVTTTMDTAETILDRDIKVTVTIPSGSATTPATTITSNPTISVNSSTGVITASNSKTQSVTPTVSAGYVTGGTSGTITVSGSNTSNLTTQAAQTIYPSTSDQTIASGKYLTGTQTIKAVTTTNLSAGNIKSGVTVKVGDSADDDRVVSVTGSYSGINVSDTTATASDVLSGKYFYTSAGTKTQGSIATKTSSNMTVSGATVTAPAGYYASNASKSVASGTATAPSAISGTSASVSTGTNTLTLSKTVSVTPNVSTAGYISSGTAGNSSVSLTASVTTKGATTYTPTTSNQTIASGTYLTGAQTISGDANLVAGNIKKDTTIFGVTGTYEGSGGGGGGTTAITFYMIASGDEYDITYIDADGNTVDTTYYTLDTEYGGSVTVNATSGTPVVVVAMSPMGVSIGTPTNTSIFSSKTGSTGGRNPIYYVFKTYIVN